jgi:hypothetical protein
VATHNSNYPNGILAETQSRSKPGASVSPRETALYIADMVLELRNLAKSTQLKSVQGLLEVTYYEAFSEANKVEIPQGETEFLETLSLDAKRAMTVA